jgi:hypothetical protein
MGLWNEDYVAYNGGVVVHGCAKYVCTRTLIKDGMIVGFGQSTAASILSHYGHRCHFYLMLVYSADSWEFYELDFELRTSLITSYTAQQNNCNYLMLPRPRC